MIGIRTKTCKAYIFDVHSVQAAPHDLLYLTQSHQFDPYRQRYHAIIYLDRKLMANIDCQRFQCINFALELFSQSTADVDDRSGV